jgi:hypothetical protein
MVAHVPTVAGFSATRGIILAAPKGEPPLLPDPEAGRPTLATGRFGPIFWAQMEDCTESLPLAPSDAQQTAWIQLLQVQEQLLPCGKCQHHFVAYKREYPPPNKPFGREAASLWLWRFHNAVNARTGRAEMLRGEQQQRWIRRAAYARAIISYEDSKGRPQEFDNLLGYTTRRTFNPWKWVEDVHHTWRDPNLLSAYLGDQCTLIVAGLLALVVSVIGIRRHRRRSKESRNKL